MCSNSFRWRLVVDADYEADCGERHARYVSPFDDTIPRDPSTGVVMVTAEDCARIIELCNNPPEPTPELIALMKLR